MRKITYAVLSILYEVRTHATMHSFIVRPELLYSYHISYSYNYDEPAMAWLPRVAPDRNHHAVIQLPQPVADRIPERQAPADLTKSLRGHPAEGERGVGRSSLSSRVNAFADMDISRALSKGRSTRSETP